MLKFEPKTFNRIYQHSRYIVNFGLDFNWNDFQDLDMIFL